MWPLAHAMDEKYGDNSSQLTSEVPTQVMFFFSASIIKNQTQNQHQDTDGGAKPYAANRAKWLGLSHIICGCVTFIIDTIKMVIFLEVSLPSYEMYFSSFYPKYFSRATPSRLQSPGSSLVDSQWLVLSPRPDAWSLQPWWEWESAEDGLEGMYKLIKT